MRPYSDGAARRVAPRWPGGATVPRVTGGVRPGAAGGRGRPRCPALRPRGALGARRGAGALDPPFRVPGGTRAAGAVAGGSGAMPGEQLRAERHQRGWTQAALAERADLDLKT